MSETAAASATLAALMATAALISGLAIRALRRYASLLPADSPNARSLHVEPVPRAGGHAIWLGFLSVALLYPPQFPGGGIGWLIPWAALLGVSALDDVREVGVAYRLGVHAAASLWAAVWLVAAQRGVQVPAGLAVVEVAAAALAIAWAANLYNFMDGNDGLAATMGIFGFGAYGVAALTGDVGTTASGIGADGSAPAFLALAAALIPFLVVNRPPATMFLGDAGAVPLGYLAAAFGLEGVVTARWPWWFPVLTFLPFVADATVTLLRRVLRRERIWEGHRGHYYQRLHRLGAGHRGTLGVYGCAMAGTAASAVVCRAYAPAAGAPALALWIVAFIILFATIDYHWRRRTAAVTSG